MSQMRKKKCFIFNCLKVYSFYLPHLWLHIIALETCTDRLATWLGCTPSSQQKLDRLQQPTDPKRDSAGSEHGCLGVWDQFVSFGSCFFFPISRNVFCHVTELLHPDGLALYTIINICHSSESLCPLTVLCFHTEPAQAINLSWQRELNIKSFFCYGENM